MCMDCSCISLGCGTVLYRGRVCVCVLGRRGGWEEGEGVFVGQSMKE